MHQDGGERMTCANCGDETKRFDSRCPECEKIYEGISDRMVAGKWRVRDEDVREELVSVIEENTEYDTWVSERVGDVYVYDSPKIDLEAGGEITL